MAEVKALNLFQRLSLITSEMKTVGKNLEIDMGSGKTYKAVAEIDVLNAVKKLEALHGVYSYPFDRTIVENKVIITNGKYGEKQQLFLRIEVVYRFINVDTPSEYIDVKSYGDGVDSQDKAPGKAMTYADKYALLKAYKIATGEDSDQEPSEELQSITEVPMVTKEQVEIIRNAYKGNEDKLATFLEKNNLEVINDMTYENAFNLIQTIKNRKSQKEVVKQQDNLGQEVSLKDIE